MGYPEAKAFLMKNMVALCQNHFRVVLEGLDANNALTMKNLDHVSHFILHHWLPKTVELRVGDGTFLKSFGFLIVVGYYGLVVL